MGMWESSKAVLVGLLAVVVLAASVLGCDGGVSGRTSSRDRDAFITDRVVEVRIVMEEEDWTACQQNALAEQYVQADFWCDGELIPDVAVRPKGNSSLREAVHSGSSRFSLKVDFNLFNRARNFHGFKKLNFSNGFSDPTLIRERLAYELFEQMGVPTPNVSHVDLWVNDIHLGVYTQVEQVDETFLSRHFPRDDGNLYKPEMPAAFLNWTGEDLEEQRARMETTGQGDLDSNQDVNLGGGRLSEIMRALGQEPTADEGSTPGPPGMPKGMPPPGMPKGMPPPWMPPPGMPPPGMPPPGMPKGMPPPGMPPPGMPKGVPKGMPPGQPRDYLVTMGLKTNENSPDHSALLHFLDILNNEPDETFPAEIEKVLDVDEALRFLAVSTLTVHLDNYIGLGHNYYLYEVDGKFSIIPWDLNMVFGTFNCGIGREGLINFYIDEPTCGPLAERPLVKRLLSHQPYLDAYHGYLETLLDGPFSVDVMESRIDQLTDLIRPFVESDELKFFSTEDFERGLTEDMKGARPKPGIPPGGVAWGKVPPGGVAEGKVPPGAPLISPESLSCLRKHFSRDTLGELRTRRPTAEELETLKSCLRREELAALLQHGFGPGAPPQQFRPPGPGLGPTALGLKTFIVERVESVRQQLAGERPSAGDGSGNGDTFGMPGPPPGGRNWRPGGIPFDR